MSKPQASVCIATHNKADTLRKVLESIYSQAFPVEVIVVDDGSEDDTDTLSTNFPIKYLRIERPCEYRNPAIARNLAAKLATTDILILQSDDVIHDNPTLERLTRFAPNTYNIGTVYNQQPDGTINDGVYTGVASRRPLFFLGSVLREHFYAIGGNDEEFTEPGFEDNWLACCLHRGLGLEALYRVDIVGRHQDHPRPAPLFDWYARMGNLFQSKWNAANNGLIPWTAAAGPWDLKETL